MTIDFYYTTLCILFFATNVFWAHQNAKLVNKLMSRNYSDYKVSETIVEKKEKNKIDPRTLADLHQEDYGSLDEIMPI